MNPLNDLVDIDPWKISQSSYSDELNRKYESLLSLGNGHMGQRANFEETYTGNTLPGSYVAGLYYPDKTRVGWWKNGYPEYFAKVLNSTNWIGVHIAINGFSLDLNASEVRAFNRTLDMQSGVLSRSCKLKLPAGEVVILSSERFCSTAERELGVVTMSIRIESGEGKIEITPFLDGDVENEDSNYDEKFWDEVEKRASNNEGFLMVKTKKLDFHLATAMKFALSKNDQPISFKSVASTSKKAVRSTISQAFETGDTFELRKYVIVSSSRDHQVADIQDHVHDLLAKCYNAGYESLLASHTQWWQQKWRDCDIKIEGDPESQQAIRYNIFQLLQTYTGHDPRLNIGPKGFTGEKYGGSTYWDTEAYCLPFYLATCGQDIARNLLIYRYRQLDKAIENAAKLGFGEGAALYPMVTMNGEECHNEWEITFEEIHRNGAIAYAIYNYVKTTGDLTYLEEYGFEVLVGIARFWAQRITWSEAKHAFVMLGVTGPNEYENNVNNNWYTNYIACWCLNYTLEVAEHLKANHKNDFERLGSKLSFDLDKSRPAWTQIVDNMHFPEEEGGKLKLQQEGYLDKENLTAADLPLSERPLNQKWSWDRILRSPFIKQADVLQGFYFFEDHFSEEELKINFDFYEPRTVHESSLSPCIHSILASKLGYEQKAFEMFLRTSRLDLDDYNREVDEGLHITSMAGTWLAMVQGFGGLRTLSGKISLHPSLPKRWHSYQFSVIHRGVKVTVFVSKSIVRVEADAKLDIEIWGQHDQVSPGQPIEKPFAQ